MGLIELSILSVGLSMDAFAVAICKGLTMSKVTIKRALNVGLYFGFFQAGMPVIGYFLAVQFADYVVAFSPWIAFVLLAFLGGKMIHGSLKRGEDPCSCGLQKEGESQCGECGCISVSEEEDLSPRKMLPLAFATSIDALAIGVSFAFLSVNLIPSVTLIGVVTLVVSMVGVKVGNVFGTRFKSKSEILGGIILVGIGINILIGHLL